MNPASFHQCTVVSLDDPRFMVEACYNPAKIDTSRQTSWSRHSSPRSNTEILEFTSGRNKTLSVDLFFEGYETRLDVERRYIKPLDALTSTASVREMMQRGKVSAPRPPFVMIVWGQFPPFKGIIESLSVSYTMFLRSGAPVRATCSLKLVEVDVRQMISVQTEQVRRAVGGR